MLFLSRRSSGACSATTSFRSLDSRRRSFTSPVLASRAVSPASRFFPFGLSLGPMALGPHQGTLLTSCNTAPERGLPDGKAQQSNLRPEDRQAQSVSFLHYEYFSRVREVSLLLISTIITPCETPLSSLTFQKSLLICRAIVSHMF